MANEVKIDKVNISVAYRNTTVSADAIYLEKTHMLVAIRYVPPMATKARRVRAVRYF